MATSKMQQRVSNYLSTYFGKYTIRENSRPTWLVSDSGQRLELDFRIDELNIAIEVQGNQHYEYIPYFHGTYDGYKQQRNRDKTKRAICQEFGILLLEIFDEQSFEAAMNAVLRRHKEQKSPKAKRSQHGWNLALTTLHKRCNEVNQMLYKEEIGNIINKANNIRIKMQKYAAMYAEEQEETISPEIVRKLHASYTQVMKKVDHIKSHKKIYNETLIEKRRQSSKDKAA